MYVIVIDREGTDMSKMELNDIGTFSSSQANTSRRKLNVQVPNRKVERSKITKNRCVPPIKNSQKVGSYTKNKNKCFSTYSRIRSVSVIFEFRNKICTLFLLPNMNVVG